MCAIVRKFIFLLDTRAAWEKSFSSDLWTIIVPERRKLSPEEEMLDESGSQWLSSSQATRH